MIEIKIMGTSAVEIMHEIQTLANRMERNEGAPIGQVMPAVNIKYLTGEAGPNLAAVEAEAKPKPAPKTKTTKPKPAEAADAKEEAIQAVPTESEEKTTGQTGEDPPTINDVKVALSRVINMEKESEAKEILGNYGAAKISELKEKDYAAVIADLKVV